VDLEVRSIEADHFEMVADPHAQVVARRQFKLG
jgi:hypothetical protein